MPPAHTSIPLLLVADRAGEVLGHAYSRVEGTDYMTLRGPAGVLHDLVVEARPRIGSSRVRDSAPP